MTAPYTYQNAHQGAAVNRLQGQWLGYEPDANLNWINDADELAARAADAVRNDPIMAALLQAKTMGEQGCRGLKFRSLVALDGDNDATSTAETDLRQAIEAEIENASCGKSLDAAGLATRREIESGISEFSAVGGESFAIRAYIPGRPEAVGATCWRSLRRDRIKAPPNKPDSPNLYRGIALDDNGAPTGIWVAPPRFLGQFPDASEAQAKNWVFVPWYDENGIPCVIHRIGRRPLGAYRGLSMFSPLLYLAKQVKSMIDAYVVAKRVQACHPIFIKCADPQAAAKKDRNGAVWGPNTTLEPGKVYYVGDDAEMFFPSWAFNGTDMQAFLDTLYRNQFAAWGLPIDVVLAQLGKTNMAASRSAWQQYYRQCEKWQDDHIEQCTAIIDLNIIQEAVLAGRLAIPKGMTIRQMMKGRYIRPARAMPDPLKEANAVAAWAALGRDLTGLFGESGVDFRDSTAQREEDNRWLAEHDVVLEADAAAAAAQAAAEAEPAPDEDPVAPAEEPPKEDPKP